MFCKVNVLLFSSLLITIIGSVGRWVCVSVGKWLVVGWSVVSGSVVGGFNKTRLFSVDFELDWSSKLFVRLRTNCFWFPVELQTLIYMLFNLVKATSPNSIPTKMFKLLINVSSQLINLFNKIYLGFLGDCFVPLQKIFIQYFRASWSFKSCVWPFTE